MSTATATLTSTSLDNSTLSVRAEAPWYEAYPAPKNRAPAAVERTQVLQWLKGEGNAAGRESFVLVDLRRTDHQGGTIRGSINLPAQSLYASIPTLYSLFSAAGIRAVVFYCGSSRGRGTRAAGWFDDYIRERGDQVMGSFVLAGGIKEWVDAGREYVEMVDQ